MLALEKEYGNTTNFIIVDIDEPQGQALARQFDIYYIPAFFLIDEQSQITDSFTGPQVKGTLENALNSVSSKDTWYESFFKETLPRAFSDGGLTIMLLVFLGGLMTSISPCTLSMLPVMLGYIGGLEKPSKSKGFITSASFVFGLAVTFAILGIAASLFGKIFGQIGPAWVYIIGLFSIIMGLQLIGVFNINLPGLETMPEKKGGIFGSFGLGLLFGLVASPCATPVLAVLMTYVAGQGVLWYGALLLFIYGLGHGLPLIIAGTFTAVIKSLPRLQRWGHYITYLSGILLILFGLYFFTQTA